MLRPDCLCQALYKLHRDPLFTKVLDGAITSSLSQLGSCRADLPFLTHWLSDSLHRKRQERCPFLFFS